MTAALYKRESADTDFEEICRKSYKNYYNTLLMEEWSNTEINDYFMVRPL